MKRFAVAVLAALLALTAPAGAADPYEINVILPLTGNIAFVGQTELQSLKALEAYINRTGGINGRPISFVVADDQNDPKTSVLLTQNLIAKKSAGHLGAVESAELRRGTAAHPQRAGDVLLRASRDSAAGKLHLLHPPVRSDVCRDVALLSRTRLA